MEVAAPAVASPKKLRSANAGAPEEVVVARIGAARKAALELKFGALKVPDLKALLKLNGLPVSGAKAELVGRAVEGEGLGVPPVCSVCVGKSRLRTTSSGHFKCPGYFDNDLKEVVKCAFEGPGKRLAWKLEDGSQVPVTDHECELSLEGEDEAQPRPSPKGELAAAPEEEHDATKRPATTASGADSVANGAAADPPPRKKKKSKFADDEVDDA
jgi:hypothetical protein